MTGMWSEVICVITTSPASHLIPCLPLAEKMNRVQWIQAQTLAIIRPTIASKVRLAPRSERSELGGQRRLAGSSLHVGPV